MQEMKLSIAEESSNADKGMSNQLGWFFRQTVLLNIFRRGHENTADMAETPRHKISISHLTEPQRYIHAFRDRIGYLVVQY